MTQQGVHATQTLVDVTEKAVQATVQAGLDNRRLLRKQMGERRYNEVRLSPEEKAHQRVAAWFVLGQAAPFDHAGNELGRAYWRKIRDALGPHDTLKWDAQNRDLYQRFSPHWQLSMPLELRQYFNVLVQVGLHSGGLSTRTLLHLAPNPSAHDATPEERAA